MRYLKELVQGNGSIALEAGKISSPQMQSLTFAWFTDSLSMRVSTSWK